MTITFAGHSIVSLRGKIQKLVKEQICRNITRTEKMTCYLGGYGEFDAICSSVCRELKQEYSGIEVIYVTPYIPLQAQGKKQATEIYDATIYPPIENVPPRFAILKRNEWMIAHADLLIAYVDHSYGGAYQSLQIAKRKKKKIINICDFL